MNILIFVNRVVTAILSSAARSLMTLMGSR